MSARLEELKKQLQQLDELGRSGALSAENLASARAELERQMLAEVMAAPAAPAAATATAPAAVRAGGKLWAGVAGFVAVVMVAGYAWLGNPGAWAVGPGEPGAAAAAAGGAGQHTMEVGQIEKLAEQLAERLKTRPDDAEGWMMLGRSYAVLGRFSEAVPAYQKVVALRPKEAQAYADLADATGMLNDRNLQGEPEKLIQQALQLDGRNLKALSLAGTVAFQRGEFAAAVRHWEAAIAAGEPGSELTRNLEAGVAEARQRGGLAAATPAAPAPAAPSGTAPAAAAAGASVSGKVQLAAALKGRAAPDDTVFIFARAAQGPKMPLAILKRQVKDLPLDFSLDDSLAMSPAAKLSGAGQVVVGARISKSGNAMPQPGDLQGLSAPVAVGAKGLVIEISEEVR